MSKIVLKGYILVPTEALETVREELKIHIEATRSEAGCLVFNVEQDPLQPSRFTVYEEFVDRKAFEDHQRRVKESRWGAVTRDVERHYEITEEST